MLSVDTSLDLWKRTCFSTFCSRDKMLFLPFSIFRFSFSPQFIFLILKWSKRNHISGYSSSSSSSSYLFPFSHLSSMTSCKRQFLLRIYPIQLDFLRKICLEASSSLIYVEESLHWLFSFTICSSPFSSSTTFQCSPNISAPVFLVPKSLNHTIHYFKYNSWPLEGSLLIVFNVFME